MNAVNIQPPQLSVKRGPAHTERFDRCRDIALGSRECPLQHSPLRHGEVFGHCSCHFRCRQHRKA
jgi:hypothetical protein